MDFHDCKRVGECNFFGNADMEEQEKCNNDYTHVENMPIPQCYRTHLVEVNHDRVMICSCCSFNHVEYFVSISSVLLNSFMMLPV